MFHERLIFILRNKKRQKKKKKKKTDFLNRKLEEKKRNMLIIMTSNLKPIKSLQIPRFNLIHTSTKTLNSLLRYKGSQPALFQVSSIFDQNLKNSLLLGMCYVGFSFLFFSFLFFSLGLHCILWWVFVMNYYLNPFVL